MTTAERTFADWLTWSNVDHMPEADYYRYVGQNIRRLREERGWTQVRLAVELDLDTGQTVHYWETAKNRPSAWMLDRLERLFGERIRP